MGKEKKKKENNGNSKEKGFTIIFTVSTLKIQKVVFIKMPFVFKRLILILFFCNELFRVILVF